jgi:hypothetical protein
LPVLSISIARYRCKMGTSAAKGKLRPTRLLLDIRLQSLMQEQSKLHPDTANPAAAKDPHLSSTTAVHLHPVDLDKYRGSTVEALLGEPACFGYWTWIVPFRRVSRNASMPERRPEVVAPTSSSSENRSSRSWLTRARYDRLCAAFCRRSDMMFDLSRAPRPVVATVSPGKPAFPFG